MATGMQAAVLYGKEDVRIEDVERPLPAAGEIVVRVNAALTCGTDLKTYRRGYHAKMLNMPALFGHELAGVVAAVGEGVSVVRPGNAGSGAEFRALRPRATGASTASRTSAKTCSSTMAHTPSGSACRRALLKRTRWRFPLHVTDEHAALTEPLACVLRGLEESRAQRGDTMAVIGAGPIGLMMIHAARFGGRPCDRRGEA